MKNLKNNSLCVSSCGVCGKPMIEGEDICAVNLNVIKDGKKTIVGVLFHPGCAGEFYRRFPETKEIEE